MQDKLGSKHTIQEETDEKKLIKQSRSQLKRHSAEALEEHQWHKHPGGG